jgi:rod shape determining protein RodA
MSSGYRPYTISNWFFDSLKVLDGFLLKLIFVLAAVGLVTLFSASGGVTSLFLSQVRNLLLSFACIWFFSQIPPNVLLRFAVPLYVFGVLLLLAVALFGDVSKGARRWLNLGVIRIQPSEIMKIAMPMMLAWYFHQKEASLNFKDFIVAALLLLIPVGLIMRQPDLGTALLVLSAGFFVIFFAGLSWRVLLGGLIVLLIVSPLAYMYGLHDYQRERIETLFDPTRDPKGAGFHIIQSVIAIGSGGVTGKGWLNGSQSYLDYIPEHTTDFILATFSEEFGWIGILVLVGLYVSIIWRGLYIAERSTFLFSRLLAASLSVAFFVYAFVNMGMVAGVLPVVGVPLPFMSYGGTALITLGVAIGMLMSIRHSRL